MDEKDLPEEGCIEDTVKKKSKIDIMRDGAFSFQVKGKDEHPDSVMKTICEVQGRLLTFKTHSIFETVLADGVDPERKNINAKGKITQIYPVGTTCPILSRTFIQAERILRLAIFQNSISKQGLKDHYFNVFESLYSAYVVYDELKAECINKINDYDVTKDVEKNYLFQSDFPQLENLNMRVISFFSSIHKALKAILLFFEQLYPELGEHTNYTELIKDLGKTKYVESTLMKMLTESSDWVETLWRIRNKIEHPSKKCFVKVKNIDLAAEGGIKLPTLSYRINSQSFADELDLINQMGQDINDMMSFSEDMLILSIQEKLDPVWPWVFYKEDESKMDPECHVRYGLTLNTELLGKGSS